MSSSEQSDFSNPVVDEECVDNQARQLEEEIKGGVPDDVLEVEEYDDNGILHTKAIRIDEENKQVVVEWSLPPIVNLNTYKSKEGLSKDNASRITAILEDGKEYIKRINSHDPGTFSVKLLFCF